MFVTTSLEGDYSNVTAHQSYGIVAGVSKEGAVTLFDEDLQQTLQTLPNTKNSLVNRLCWHPTKKFLLISWSSGSLGLWCVDTAESSVREGNLHSSPISCMEWSPSGNQLITGDEDGAVVVWKVDSRGKLSKLSQYRLRGAITHACFKTNVQRSKETRSKETDPPFFLGDSSGTLFFADDAGHCTESLCLPQKISLMKFHEGRDLLLVLSEDLLLSHFLLNGEGKLILDTAWPQVKLGGGVSAISKGSIQSVMIEPNMIAFSIGNTTPKVWDSENEETFFLEMAGMFDSETSFMNMSFSKRKDILAVSTASGHVILWSRIINGEVSSWEPLQKIEIVGIPTMLSWGMGNNYLCISTPDGFQLLSEQILHTAGSNADIFVSQVGSKKILLETAVGKIQAIEVKSKIKGLAVSKEVLAVWTGSALELYLLDGLNSSYQGSMNCSSGHFSVSHLFTFCLTSERNSICVNHLSSNSSFKISLPSSDGEICAICSTDFRIHLFTTQKILKTFEIGKREAKLVLMRKLDFHFESTQNLIMKSNVDGSFFSFLTTSDPNTMLVFSVDSGELFTHDCGSKIKAFCWDEKDSRVLGTQIMPTNGKENGTQIISFFATNSQLVFKDIQGAPPDADSLISISLPKHYYFKKTEFKAEQSSRFMSKLIKEYSGIDELDGALIKTISDFSFKLAIGQLDDAARVVKLIKNEAVWENMSQVCIKMRRTKLARLCMGKLKNAKALRTIATTQKARDDNSLAAQFALHLGLYEEAKEIWSETGNYAQLISYHQAAGEWEKALEISAKKDRPSLPTTYFKFGNHLATESDKIGAIAAFEKSRASKAQILRMMLSEPDELQKYVDLSSDKETKKWWAQNAESHGDVDTALKYYTEIGDVFSIVRVHCRAGDLKKATELTDLHPESLISAYYVAREFEKEKNWTDAIAYYSKAKCYSSAIRIAKENNIDKELLQLALQSNSTHMTDVARYFEKLGDLDKAIALYSKSGNIQKALSLCYKTKNISMMESIISRLDPVTDESSLKNISKFLSDHGSHESALKLLITSQKFQEALDILETESTPITDDLYNSFKLPSTLNDQEFRSIHKRVAQLCLVQGAYQLACKSFTLAGDRLNAMGALLKSGDKDKIITFANVSRNSEIFIIAANYLQSLNWVNDMTVMRTIIQFYTKAKANGSLARFYESCAQVEIDEFQNYEKALGALNEAEACEKKDNEGMVSNALKTKKDAVALFIQALEQGKLGDAEKCEHICAELLNYDGIDDFVRIGDILGLLIETNYKSGNISKAKELFKRLQARSVTVSVQYYVNDEICSALDETVHDNHHIEENIAAYH